MDKNEIKRLRKKLGLTQEEFAGLANVSKKTVEHWETKEESIKGTIVTLLKLLNEYPELAEKLLVPEKIYPLRLWYMFEKEVCTIIDVDERMQKIKIFNYTNDFMKKAFGNNDAPDFTDYKEFLKSRCFPESRDKIKLVLRELNLPFYDPFLIIEKTEGRMAEDDFWIRIER